MKRRVLLLSLAGTMALSSDLRAQPRPVIGLIYSNTQTSAVLGLAAFREGLGEAGFAEGHNVTIDHRWADGDYGRLPVLINELVNRKVNVIFAAGGPVAMAARAATSTIPIVFYAAYDPVSAGLVASLARPGGNVTGISVFGRVLNPKRLQLIAEMVPDATAIGVLQNQNAANADAIRQDLQDAAHVIGRTLVIVQAGTPSEIDAAFASLGQSRAGALVVAADTFLTARHEQIVALATRHAIPAIYQWREFAEAGGLASYGPDLGGIWRQSGVYVGRVLAGAKPADLPIQQPTRLELVINLATAKVLGLTIPSSILARADEVIE